MMRRRLSHAIYGLGIFAFALTGCQSTQSVQENGEASTEVAPSENSVQPSEYPSASQEPTNEIEEISNCSSAQYVGIIVSGWESVTASKGAPDHGERIESLQEDVGDLVEDNSDESPCTGAVELAEFNFELAVLRASELTGASSDDYQTVADAGNEWLEVIEPEREYSFEAEYSD